MLPTYLYYTGVIFRGYTYGTGDAVVKGGRYDTLLAHFGKNAPSAGFVVVLDSLMNALQRQKIAIETRPERVTITYRPEEREKAHREAAALRAEGRYVELILED
jgi:ATP phosphoribosyltransferase regulatory subunit